MAEAAELPVGAVADKPGITVVTGETMEAYVSQELAAKAPPVEENPDPEAEAAKEFAELEEKAAAKPEPKEGDVDGSKVFFRGKWVQKHDFAYRVHLKTEEARAEYQAKIDAAAAEAKAAKEAAETASRERDELRAKYEPPKSMEIGPEPQPSQFSDIGEYSKALKEWASHATLVEETKKQQERAAKEATAAAQKAWNDRLEATKKTVPDYEQRIASSSVKVSNELRDAIHESDVGPRVLYHLAEHPEVADFLSKLTPRKMLVEFGKLEASLGVVEKPATTTVAEVSKAPAPISPLKSVNSAPGVKIDGEGKFYGTYEEYKAARRAGKIK